VLAVGDAKSVPDAVRTKGRELAQRIQDDPDFRQQVEADPYAALREAGLPEGAHADFMREAGIEADVIGYKECMSSCVWTCVTTLW
jgi:hypothetical protein